MDAAAADADVKLYKASAELLSELQEKLPLLLDLDRVPRKWTLYHKGSELAQLLDRFQEWPQLLDPILANLIHSLADAFLAYCLHSRDSYSLGTSVGSASIEPLPQAICRLLYAFCKVRGHKVIVRLLNNEPKYIEPLLICFQKWSLHLESEERSDMPWEQRYVMLLWLSHLMLAPFELATISGFSSVRSSTPQPLDELQLPKVAQVLLDVAFKYLFVPGKDREAASTLIVRLTLRKDMQAIGCLEAVALWCTNQICDTTNDTLSDHYRHVGLLTLLFGLVNSSSSTEAAPFITQTFSTCKGLSTELDSKSVAVRQSAPSRKLLIKIMRACLLHAIALSGAGSIEIASEVDTMIEDGIQILLEWLADSDTPVRQAASKAIGMIVLKLERDLAIDVIEAVLGCFDENVLLEDIRTGQLTAKTDLLSVDALNYTKNVNAVDPLKWHGAMLSLGHVLFRRSPPPEQLSSILEALLMGLTFEQRSNVGTSLGVGVRDAACFGIWSLARKYSTQEVDAAVLQNSASNITQQFRGRSTLQVIATELVLASCLDPSGNLRRGASAALQELIGRHPDIIHEGISVVQQVDYHAVARRSRAISEVTEAVACLGEVYHTSLLFALLDWRGCRAVDAESRRQAASTIGRLFSRASSGVQMTFAKELVSQIQGLHSRNHGTNAATRHGLLLSISAVLAIVETTQENGQFTSTTQKILHILAPAFTHFDSTVGNLSGRVTGDLSNVLVAVSSLIGALARTNCIHMSSQNWKDRTSPVMTALERCITAADDDLVARTAAEANFEVFALLPLELKIDMLRCYMPKTKQKQKSVYTCKGRLLSISMLFSSLMEDSKTAAFSLPIVEFLASIVSSDLAIETRINAMEGISAVLRSEWPSNNKCLSILASAVSVGLADYTADQRGDVGSLLRLSSIEALPKFNHHSVDDKTVSGFLTAVTRLSAEKLSKVRFVAWTCLQTLFRDRLPANSCQQPFLYQSDISSFAYYRQLVDLLDVSSLRKELLLGLVGSIAGGSDDVSQTSSSALISFLDDARKNERVEQLEYILNTLTQQLRINIKQDDRELVPVLDTMCLLIEQFPDETSAYLVHSRSMILALTNDLQTSIADIQRLQSLIRLLSQLSLVGEFRLETTDQITRKLLHKWPKVRQAAADAVFLLDPAAVSLNVDWNAAPTVNKGEVVELRKKLGVAGKGGGKT